jgi:hypothetical protein
VNAGGFAGNHSGSSNSIRYCYNTGTISATTSGTVPVTTHGFVAVFPSGTITACYYNTDTTGHSESSPGAITPVSTGAMKSQGTYAGWDFTSASPVWSINSSINSGYPYLTGMVP